MADSGNLMGRLTDMPINGMNREIADAQIMYDRNLNTSIKARSYSEYQQYRSDNARTMVDDAGNRWRYFVEDSGLISVLDCRVAEPILRIPKEIEGLPVRWLDPDSFKENPVLEEIECHDGIERIGAAAFRRNPNLRKVIFPRNCDAYELTWLRDCPRLEYVALPGALRKLTSAVVDTPSLCTLVVGPDACEVEPGMFEKSTLRRIEVDVQNPHLRSDGVALYSANGEKLIALAVQVSNYEVHEGTREICAKALGTFPCLSEVVLPESVEVIGDYAFSRAGISVFRAPKNLKQVGGHAFYNCHSLEVIELNDGLLSLGESVFCGTAIKRLMIPASIEEMSGKLADDGALSYAGKERTFELAEGARHFLLDEWGGLYRRDEDGLVFARLMDSTLEEYELLSETRVVAERACYRHLHIKRLVFPQGLEEIREAAFRGCEKLAEAILPSSMLRVDKEAFLDTSITSVYIGKNLTRVGDRAFVTMGAHRGTRRSINDLTVEEGNERFYAVPGLLIERLPKGKQRVVLGVNGATCIKIPPEVTTVAAYALHGARRIREFWISDRITDVEVCGLAIKCSVGLLHIDLVKPIEGHDFIELRFPDNERAAQAVGLAFSSANFVDVEHIIGHYDDTILNLQGSGNKRSLMETYVMATRALERLKDPIYLTPTNKSLYEKFFTLGLMDSSMAIARHDDRRAFDDLIDLGFITKDNISDIIDEVSVLQDAATTGYLLDKKHELVAQSGGSFMDDFEL